MCTHCCGKAASKPLDHQGIPLKVAILKGQAEGNGNANHHFGQEFGKTLSS